MKVETFKPLIVFSIVFGIFYLVGSYYSASFNLTEWKDATRFVTALCGVVLGGIVTAFYAEIKL